MMFHDQPLILCLPDVPISLALPGDTPQGLLSMAQLAQTRNLVRPKFIHYAAIASNMLCCRAFASPPLARNWVPSA